MAEDRSKHPNEKEREVPEPIGDRNQDPDRLRVRSNTPENLRGEINPSAPTAGTEGPSTNIAGANIANDQRFRSEERKQANDGQVDDVQVVIPQADGDSKPANAETGKRKEKRDKVA